MRYFFLVIIAICLSVSAGAQATKIYRPTALWTHWQADYQFKNKSMLFAAWQTRSSTESDFNTLSTALPFNQFSRMQWLAGYAFPLSERWSAALSFRLATQKSSNVQYYRGYVSHRGHIAKLLFVKALSLERKTASELSGGSAWRVRGKVTLSKNLKIADKHIVSPSLSYEVFSINPDEEQTGDQTRKFDRTRLQLAIAYAITPQLLIEIFGIRQTDYYKALVTGNPPPPTPQYKNLNIILPIYGLTVRWQLGQQEDRRVYDLP